MTLNTLTSVTQYYLATYYQVVGYSWIKRILILHKNDRLCIQMSPDGLNFFLTI